MNANLDLAFDFLQPIKVKALKMLSSEENIEQSQKKKGTGVSYIFRRNSAKVSVGLISSFLLVGSNFY